MTPQRHLPRTVLAEDPPLGRILVVTGDAPLTLEVQRILRDAGYRVVGPAASADEADRLAASRPIDGAVVDVELGIGPSAAVAERLSGRDIPFVWLADTLHGALPRTDRLVPVVRKPIRGDRLIQALERARASRDRVPADHFYPVPPPQEAWPRIFPQL
jgi:DNA-binding NarL/FixJ family response regulator